MSPCCALPSCLEAALWVLESVVQMGRPPDGLQRTICGSLVRKLQVEITVPALLWLLSLVLSSVKLIDIVAIDTTQKNRKAVTQEDGRNESIRNLPYSRRKRFVVVHILPGQVSKESHYRDLAWSTGLTFSPQAYGLEGCGYGNQLLAQSCTNYGMSIFTNLAGRGNRPD
ncbi:hypothetical protein P389DRAFT_179788 [Cystobasidium minutum MCA 4210]|uniref:uncharacterized protein n=1 Tax=Cystobasidium minutum MCA 4210 TaxID=1397322 RepID=UPI0034CD490D|eukprot:jgi/Rhomi1/179788/fgenesh1_pg.4_\